MSDRPQDSHSRNRSRSPPRRAPPTGPSSSRRPRSRSPRRSTHDKYSDNYRRRSPSQDRERERDRPKSNKFVFKGDDGKGRRERGGGRDRDNDRGKYADREREAPNPREDDQRQERPSAPPAASSSVAKPPKTTAAPPAPVATMAGQMIEVIANDRLGTKVRVKCSSQDTIGDLKMLIAAQTGTKPEKIVLKKWYTIYKNHITLADYEIHNGMSLELH